MAGRRAGGCWRFFILCWRLQPGHTLPTNICTAHCCSATTLEPSCCPGSVLICLSDCPSMPVSATLLVDELHDMCAPMPRKGTVRSAPPPLPCPPSPILAEGQLPSFLPAIVTAVHQAQHQTAAMIGFVCACFSHLSMISAPKLSLNQPVG